MAAALSANAYTHIPNFRIVISAFSKKQLDPTLAKVWTQLDWLNENTELAFKRVRMVQNTKDYKRASRKDKTLGESGHKSEIEGMIVDDPDKLRGDRTQRLIYEECFGEGTPVRMYDLSIKNIEDIEIGDFLLGPNGEKQIVEKINVGEDQLYEVQQKRACSYTVTHNHPLYVEQRPRTGGKPDQIKLITPTEYLELSNYSKRTTYGLQSGIINFNEQSKLNVLSPYYLGLWLGDGHSDRNDVVVNKTEDLEILNYLKSYAESLGTHIEERNNNSPSTNCEIKNIHINSTQTININKELKNLGVLNNKHIPKTINYLSQEDRLDLLAGLIDSDGNLAKSGSYSFYYEITMSRKWLIEEIALLARISGFDIKVSEKKGSGFNKKGIFYRVTIKGNVSDIPVKVSRKQVPKDYKKTNTVNSTGLDIVDKGIGKYYGIKLKQQGNGDSDHLFLLEDFTIVHNCGADPILIKKWVKGEALIQVLGGKRVGFRLAFGTGGSSKASSMEGLEKMITNPLGYNILPVRHNFTSDRSYKITGYFIPAYRVVYDYVDNRGYCNEQACIDYYKNERKKKESDPKDLLEYKSEYCFTIEEALIQNQGNIFPVEEISQQLTNLEIYKETQKPKRGFLNWATIPGTDTRNGKVKWRDDPNGNILLSEHPIRGEEGEEIDNLYVGGIDSIDIGGKDSATQDESKLSDFCILIKKRQYGLDDPKYVAMYKDRPRDIHEAYETAAKLLVYFNAKAVLESTRTAILTYFKNKKYLRLLMKRPKSTLSDITKTNTNMYGSPASEKVIMHYSELIYDYCLSYSHTIVFREMLEQLLNYSYEKKKKFDIIAAMGFTELADEDLSFKKPKEKVTEKLNSHRDIGYWWDDKGYKRYGIIPKTQEERNKYERPRRQDSWLYKELI